MIVLGVLFILAAFTTFSELGYDGILPTIIGIAIGSALIGYGITRRKQKEQQTVIVNNYIAEPQPAGESLYARQKASRQARAESHPQERFAVAGVTFRNDDGSSRQKILRNLCEGDDYGTAGAVLEEYDFEGEQAIRVVTLEGCVGNIRRSDRRMVSRFLDRTVHSVNVEIGTFENDEGKVIYRADVVITMDREDPAQQWYFDEV